MALAALAGVFATRSRSAGSQADPHSGQGAGLWLGALAIFAIGDPLVGWLKLTLDFPRPLLALPPGSVGAHLLADVAARYLVGLGAVSGARIGNRYREVAALDAAPLHTADLGGAHTLTTDPLSSTASTR